MILCADFMAIRLDASMTRRCKLLMIPGGKLTSQW